MIKPVYFSKKDGILIEHINKVNNFSEWVKDKIREELYSNQIGIVGNNNIRTIMTQLDTKDIERLIRKIINEEMVSTEEDKVYIEEEENIEKNIIGWTL